MTFGKIAGFPQLHVLDSTDPAQIQSFESKIDLAKTLFIVSSKSGSTLEPNIFKQYFFERVKQAVGADKAGSRFIAITDPGSKMQQVAEGDRFRHIFARPAQHRRTLLGAVEFRHGSRGGDGARHEKIPRSHGRDGAGLRILRSSGRESGGRAWAHPWAPRRKRVATRSRSSPRLASSIWAHGSSSCLPNRRAKQGKGIIPVDRESHRAHPTSTETIACSPTCGWKRRRMRNRTQKVAALEKAGHPVVRIAVGDTYDLGQEFFRWEIATAVAGSVLGINAFNQPDVEASKIVTKNLTSEYEKTGSLPAEKPVLEDKGVKLFTDEKNAAELAKGAGSNKTLVAYLKRISAASRPATTSRCSATSR